MDKTKALQKLLNGTATEKEIESLKQALVSGEISIGGDVNRSVVIIGSGNKVELTAEALNLLKPETTKENSTAAEGEPPYMGLRYFDTSDKDLFYGREALTRELLARVQKESFLAIVGASGSGKSSVARAGLIPVWKKENQRGAIYIVTPGVHPIESLAASLTRESESVTATSTLMDDMGRDVRSLRLYTKKTLGETNLLLLVDQFEEIFTLCKDITERRTFIENLLLLANEGGTARVVITLRADFYHHCADYEGLRLALEKHQAYIGAMTVDELRQAITEPARKNGWDFQPGLVDLFLSDVGAEPGALPLLSHALLETWKRRQGRTLTLQGYADAGGVKKAIAQTAESVYGTLTPAEQTIARGIFLRLTELGEGTQDTRRRVKMDELAQAKEQDAVIKVLKTLTDARLVTTEEDSAEVAHEALIREWETLRKWLDEDRESLRMHRHLTENAEEWVRRGREASELYRGARLIQLQEWVEKQGNMLSPLEMDFLNASQNAKRREQLRSVGIGIAGVVLLLMIVLGVTGKLNRFIYRPIDMDNYWVTIPAGRFLMGSDPKTDPQSHPWEQPQHWVDLDTYQIGKYDVTNRQFSQCVKAGICGGKSSFAVDRALHPVVNVTWDDAVAYCKWVGGRLPTAAEWEKAASWNDKTKTKYIYPWGNKPPTADLLNYNNNRHDTTPVGKYESGKSPYGLYDMAGNVWDWVNDWYSATYYQSSTSSNPSGPPEPGTDWLKEIRGGSWDLNDNFARSSDRGGFSPADSTSDIGFRCSRSS